LEETVRIRLRFRFRIHLFAQLLGGFRAPRNRLSYQFNGGGEHLQREEVGMLSFVVIEIRFVQVLFGTRLPGIEGPEAQGHREVGKVTERLFRRFDNGTEGLRIPFSVGEDLGGS
jgi:hypothetical protein